MLNHFTGESIHGHFGYLLHPLQDRVLSDISFGRPTPRAHRSEQSARESSQQDPDETQEAVELY